MSKGKAGDLLVLNDDDIVDLLKAAVKREGGQTAFAKRYDVNRTELNSTGNIELYCHVCENSLDVIKVHE